mmetsp:Transcript_44270/g.73811  ORF Transcript_44270/g.73811 Transcript_44270/m.73811 type:complete len:107 (-) Transcript_44270:137-457(-)
MYTFSASLAETLEHQGHSAEKMLRCEDVRVWREFLKSCEAVRLSKTNKTRETQRSSELEMPNSISIYIEWEIHTRSATGMNSRSRLAAHILPRPTSREEAACQLVL